MKYVSNVFSNNKRPKSWLGQTWLTLWSNPRLIQEKWKNSKQDSSKICLFSLWAILPLHRLCSNFLSDIFKSQTSNLSRMILACPNGASNLYSDHILVLHQLNKRFLQHKIQYVAFFTYIFLNLHEGYQHFNSQKMYKFWHNFSQFLPSNFKIFLHFCIHDSGRIKQNSKQQWTHILTLHFSDHKKKSR